MKDHSELGKKIAREIFKSGDEPENPCRRIQLMGGQYPDKETNNGGYCESSLADLITHTLKNL